MIKFAVSFHSNKTRKKKAVIAESGNEINI